MIKAINTARATTNGRIATQSTASKPRYCPIILHVDRKIPPLSRPKCAADIDLAVGWQLSLGYWPMQNRWFWPRM